MDQSTDYPLNFARHFARLVWLILHMPAEIEEQKVALRALAAESRLGAIALGVSGETLEANGAAIPSTFTGVGDVVHQMTSHGLGTIGVDQGAQPADILAIARILSEVMALYDEGAGLQERLADLAVTTVHVAAKPLDAAPVGTDAAPAIAPTPEPPKRDSGSLPDFDFGEVFEDPLAEAASRATPRYAEAIPSPGDSEKRTGMFAQFARMSVPTQAPEQVLSRLEATEGGEVSQLLDDLSALCEIAARDAKPALVCDILYRIVRRESTVADWETKRVIGLAIKRLAKPTLLRVVTAQLPHYPERREEYITVLIRAGEEGADALVEQLAVVSHPSDRRVYFDVLLRLKAGVPTLVHMLGDTRWFVARNAADLLGEMQAREAEEPLTELLRRDDERVRRSASTALMRLGTPRAMHAIDGALKDPTPQTRMEAAAALATRKDLRTAATLIRALDAEKDDDVKASFLAALGKLRTPDAVQRLIQAAEPERGLFKKKSAAVRIAALQGLAEARTPEAMDALRALQSDKDGDVKDAATFALGRIARATVAVTRQPD